MFREVDRRREVRVLHVIPSLGMGGVERMLTDLLQVFRDDPAVRCKVCVLGREGCFYESKLRGYEPVYLDFDQPWRALSPSSRCVARLRRFVRDFQPHVVHSHLWLADLYSALAVLGTRAAHLCHLHNTVDWITSRRLGFRCRKQVYRLALAASRAEFIACSDAARWHFCRHMRVQLTRVKTIRYGVDLAAFSQNAIDQSGGNGDGPIIFGAAGRFVPRKGHEDLLRAVATLARQPSRFIVRLAGDGPLRARYEELVDKLGIGDRVAFLGPVADMPRFYRELDVFVQPSHEGEGLPLTILEALAMGKPVVATAIAGAPEVICDGENGLIVTPRDVAGLAAALSQLVGDGDARARMGCAAARTRESLSLERMAGRIRSAYERLHCRAQGGR